jgi:galactonate dehydratase
VRIESIDAFPVAPSWLFVRVRTDQGITGWGECGDHSHPAAVAEGVRALAVHLVGQDPLRLEHHWQVMVKAGFFRGGPILSAAVAGIDIALWDIAGKAFDTPAHQLLGGAVRDRVRVYAWIGRSDLDGSDELASHAAEKVAAGFDAVKMTPWLGSPEEQTSRLTLIRRQAEAVRDAIGPDRDVMIDLHGRATPQVSRRLLPLLEPVLPLFVEEPVLPEYPEALERLAQTTSIPLAVGERLYSRWDAKSVVTGGVSVLQPDACLAAGISEVRRIASLAEAWGCQIALHMSFGPICLAASLQLASSIPNFLILEQDADVYAEAFARYVSPALFRIEGGAMARPDGPGLGLEVDEDAVVNADAHSWEPRRLRSTDGAFLEW